QDSLASFGNLHAYKDEIVPWMKTMVDECHELGATMMIQRTRPQNLPERGRGLGYRTYHQGLRRCRPAYASVRSVLNTVRSQGLSAFQSIQAVIVEEPLIQTG
ncbi:MAG: hypothetical protein QGF71_01180, partial [Rhodospirillales bacterium]|nr:hypothetical protein [Rhodospirillales bacterium]